MSAASSGGALERAHALAGELLRPRAEQVDRSVVPRSHLDSWAAAGLLGLAGPRAWGGAGAPASLVREVTEVLAGACGATWFVAAQHGMPLGVLAASPNVALQHRLLGPMCTGEALSGVAIAHLRRTGSPAVAATRVAGGWRFDGHVGWMSSWGICDVFLLAAVSERDEVVLAMLPAREGKGVSASTPMELAAMQASSTVTLDVDALLVPDDDVADVLPIADWQTVDAARTANAGAHTFGLQREAVRRLAETASRRDDGTAAALAQQLAREGERLRRVAYTLLDDVPAAERTEDRLAVRASALELSVRTTTALVTATGGGALPLTAAPQRLAREAMFHLVQAQTGPSREATLQLLRDLGA